MSLLNPSSPNARRRSLVGLGLVCVVVASVLPAAATSQPAGQNDSAWNVDSAVPGRMLVTYRQPSDLARQSVAGWQSLATTGVRRGEAIAERVALLKAEPERVQAVRTALLEDPTVLAVEPDFEMQFSATPNDPSYDLQWSHQQANAEPAWNRFTGKGPGDTAPLIAVLDSGADATHPDLQNIIVQSLRAVDGRVESGTRQNDNCRIGHGTAVAGTVAAEGDNNVGVAGALWQARLIDIALTSTQRDVGCTTGPLSSDIVAAMNYVTELTDKPQVMNLSLGTNLNYCPDFYKVAVDQARAAGIAIVAAAGNADSSDTSVPASCDGVISVAATGSDGQPAPYSQTNPQIDLAAPGGDAGTLMRCPTYGELAALFILTTGLDDVNNVIGGCDPNLYTDPNGDRLVLISGTSFAAPYVSGAVALIRQFSDDRGTPLNVDRAEAILEFTAREAGAPGRDCAYGWGIVDLGAAVQAVVDGIRPTLQADPPIGSGSCDGTQPAPEPTATVKPIEDPFVPTEEPTPEPTAEPTTEPTQSPTEGPPFDPPPEPDGFVTRIQPEDDEATSPIRQAIEISAVLPPEAAPYGVLARVDDFADALTGSSLGLGQAPLLYTSNDGPLDERTLTEFRRVLDFAAGTPTVYIMGGPAAVPADVDGQLRDEGINPVRVAGAGREATAVEAASVVEQLKVVASPTDRPTRDYAFVAYGRNFPDAVAAGQMSAYYGIPILVTNTEALHPQAEAALQSLQPEQVYVLGGQSVISDTVVTDIQRLGLPVSRLAGGSRVDTALEIARLYREELQNDADLGPTTNEPALVAVNLRNNFNDVLAASLLGGRGNVFVPLEGEDGSIVTAPVAAAFCGFASALFLIGGQDVISQDGADELADIVLGRGC